jgi:hypothetical protein
MVKSRLALRTAGWSVTMIGAPGASVSESFPACFFFFSRS